MALSVFGGSMGIKKLSTTSFVCEFCYVEIQQIKVVNNYYACAECYETKSRRLRLLEAEKEWDSESQDDTKIRN